MTATIDFHAWLARWDRQQEGYQADREERFQAMFDALEAIAGGPDLTVLDLGSGPGSLAVRLLDRFPGASVVAVDVDPVLLTLGRGAYGGRRGLRFVEADLREPDWTARLGLTGPVDGVLSTTALHWLSGEGIARLYRDLAGLLRPGGAFLDGDHRRFGPRSARLAEAGAAMAARRRERAGAPASESWQDWWEAVRAEPALAAAVAQRDRLGHAHPEGRHELSDGRQRRLLLEAGFAEAGILWQCGDERVLAAVR
jgi:SAM-dependent methyltransferase